MPRPFRIWLYPVPALVALVGWIFVFITSDWRVILLGLGSLALGVVCFLGWSWRSRRWPFERPGVVVPSVMLLTAFAPLAAGQSHHAQHLGDVRFETSCNEAAQSAFDRGMRYQHSFWYRESKTSFEEALRADPKCTIAYWGIAQSLMVNPFNPTPPKNLAEGRALIQKATQLGAGSERENDLIRAVGVFYTDFETLNQRTRAQSYTKAMETVAGKYRDDEVQIYYALALDMSAPPDDKTYANQLKAASILEPIAQRQPNHPGVVHYLIHTYDYPALAAKGLDAAVRYARIAEAAPHAQHMPSHIFTRVGRWHDSIASNGAAAKLAKAANEPDDRLHAMDYMVYAYLQLARDREARAIVDEMSTVTGFNPDRNTGPFALAASPARYAIERGDWAAAAQLSPRPSKFGYADAMTYFARALGAVRSGMPAPARANLERLTQLRDGLRAAQDAYWAEQVDIQREVIAAWLLNADGKQEAALTTMQAAADAEDKTDKATVTPGPLVPARELYGALLLERGMAREALAAYEQVMAKEPNRFRSLAGAANAAERLGETAKAKTYYSKLVAMTDGADADRRELVAARQFLKGRR
jgi:tetratricopeptide (TPR) repeat protein